MIMQRPDGPNGHHIRFRKQGGEGSAAGDQLLGGFIPILVREPNTLIIQFLVIVNAMIPEGLEAAFVAKAAGIGNFPVTAYDDKFPMAQGDQRIHSASGRLPVIRADTGQIMKRKIRSIVGHQDTGNVDLLKISFKINLTEINTT